VGLEGLYLKGSIGLLVVAAMISPVLFFVNAPYGRHAGTGWGPRMSGRIGWVVMESPAVLLFGWVFFRGEHAFEPIPLLFLGLWNVHYLQRAFVYPWLLRTDGKRQTLTSVALGTGLQCVNAPLNAIALSHLGSYGPGWLTSPQFGIGVALFFIGYGIHLHSDAVLRALRGPGETGYRIPHGGLFRWITSPNYLGEIVEWCGWALATGSLAGLAFAAFTVANLLPRSLANHRWYLRRFPDYPTSRKAILPGIL
jgi:protein-S-isoprenylcysteine O-methyltransferase Ste14